MGEGGVAEPSASASASSPCALRRRRAHTDIGLRVDLGLLVTTPCCANITALNLTLNPILRIPATATPGATRRARRLSRPGPARARPRTARDVAGLLVAERNIAGIVGVERERNAAHLGLHRIDRVRLGLDRDMALTDTHPPIKAFERIEAADGLVACCIDRKPARGVGTRRGERNGVPFRRLAGLVRRPTLRPARSLPRCPVHRFPPPAGEGRVGTCPGSVRVGPPPCPSPTRGRQGRQRRVEQCCRFYSCHPPRHWPDSSASSRRRGGSRLGHSSPPDAIVVLRASGRRTGSPSSGPSSATCSSSSTNRR